MGVSSYNLYAATTVFLRIPGQEPPFQAGSLGSPYIADKASAYNSAHTKERPDLFNQGPLQNIIPFTG